MCCITRIIQIGGGGGGPIVNIYNTDGTLTGIRTVNQNNQNITWNTGTAAFIINGKLTVTGMIDPIGVQFTTSNSVAVGATGVGKGTIFVSDGAGGLNLDHPYFKDAAGTLFDLLQAGTNIYTADGTVTSPVRTMTIGTSKVDFNATSALSETTNFHQEGNNLTLNSANSILGVNSSFITAATFNSMQSNNGPLDRGATITTYETAEATINAYNGSQNLTLDINLTTANNPYFDFSGGSNPFEIRLQGNPGNAGEVLTSNGPLAYPTWNPVTVTANSLDNLSFTTDIDWDFNNNDWNLNNIDNLAIDANSFNLNSPIVCFTGITQNDTLNRFMVQDAGGCISWRDVSTLPGAGGGITSFVVAGNSGANQTITNANTLSILGSGLITTVGSATDTITASIVPGVNGQVLTTSVGVPTWSNIGLTLNTVNFLTAATWDFNNNDWTINNIDDWTVDSNTISFNAPSICFTGITQNDTLTRFMVQNASGCISWRDVSTLPGAGGGMTSFTVAGNIGVNQSITDTNTLSIIGSGLLQSSGSATDTITMTLLPGTAGQILTTSVGLLPAWTSASSVFNTQFTNVNLSGPVTWDFNNTDWTINNVDDWIVDSNTISFNAPSICFTGITQNDALTRILAMNASGCLSWRDVTTIGGGTITGANSGLSVSGANVQLGSSAGAGSALVSNRNIDMAGFGITFKSSSVGMSGAPSGQSTNLIIGNNYGQILSSNGYDSQNVFPDADFDQSVGYAVWNSVGTMKRVDHDQMPYHNRSVSANTTLGFTDSIVEVDTTVGAVTITLPVGAGTYRGTTSSDGQGKIYTIKKVAGGNNVTVVASGGGLIDGAASKVISNTQDACSFQATSATAYSIIYDYEPGGGSGVTLADNGISISGGTTAQLGTPLAGTGVPFTVNRYVDLAGKQFSFTDNTGASRVLLVEATQNQAWRSDYYDLSSTTIQHQKADRPAFMTNLGHLQMQDRVVRRAVTNVSADYTVVPTTDEHIHVDTTGGPVTITLASLAPAGATSARRADQGTNDWFQYLTISRHGGNTLTIQAAGGQTIDFAASITVNNNRGVSIQGVSTTEWVTINNA